MLEFIKDERMGFFIHSNGYRWKNWNDKRYSRRIDRLVNDEVTHEGEEWEKLRFHGESSDMHSSERGSP